ncbi:MAG: ABC transporter ATP-binding protein [Rhodospirillales bacterium]|nr:ABC transporter ATP-binding protein [Rhodospirillales bacterium]
MAGAPALRLERLSKSFAGVPAVSQATLEVRRGELFSLLGASGCGKTTLLRLIAGLETPDAGRVIIDGVDMTDRPPYERPVNTVFQSYALFPHMSVAGNIAFGLRQERLGKAEIRDRVRAMLELVQMADVGERRPHQLSGGQRQRVALARSLAKLPKVLLLDEPLAALDRKLREQTQIELINIQAKTGITFILVTHDQDEAMSMSTRIAVMAAARIVQIGRPEEIYEAPASRLVADFVGRVNLVDGEVLACESGMAVIRAADGSGELRVRHGTVLMPGAQVWVAVRPERLVIGDAPPTDGVNRGHGTVSEIAYFGDMTVYHLASPAGRRVRLTVANAARGAVALPRRGETMAYYWAPDSGVVLTQ